MNTSFLRGPTLCFSPSRGAFVWGPVESIALRVPMGEEWFCEWVTEPPGPDDHYYRDIAVRGSKDEIATFTKSLKLESAPASLVKIGGEFLFGEGDESSNGSDFLEPASVKWSVLGAINNGSLSVLVLRSYVALAVLTGELHPILHGSARRQRRQLEALTLREFVDLASARGLEVFLSSARVSDEAEPRSRGQQLKLGDDVDVVASLIAASAESGADVDMLRVRKGLDERYLRRVERAGGSVGLLDLFGRLFMTDRRLAVGLPGREISLASADPWEPVKAIMSTVG